MKVRCRIGKELQGVSDVTYYSNAMSPPVIHWIHPWPVWECGASTALDSGDPR